MAKQARIVLSTSYQWLKDLLKTYTDVQGLAEYRTNWKKIKFLYPDSDATGVISGSRNPNLVGYAFRLLASDDEVVKQHGASLYDLSTCDIALKSSVDTDVCLIELED